MTFGQCTRRRPAAYTSVETPTPAKASTATRSRMPAGLTGDSGEASKNRLRLTGDWLGVGLGTGELCGAGGSVRGWWVGARRVGRLGS
jgi:hypothetical protein